MLIQKRKRHKPNQIPLKDRILCCVLPLILVVYGIVAYMQGDLYVPARRGGIHLQGIPMILMLAAIAFATVAMVFIVIDHYDRRDNEQHYQLILRVVQGIAWTCFAGSLIVDVFWK